MITLSSRYQNIWEYCPMPFSVRLHPVYTRCTGPVYTVCAITIIIITSAVDNGNFMYRCRVNLHECRKTTPCISTVYLFTPVQCKYHQQVRRQGRSPRALFSEGRRIAFKPILICILSFHDKQGYLD